MSLYQVSTDCYRWEQSGTDLPTTVNCLSSRIIQTLTATHAAVGILSDFIFAVLPNMIIYSLSLPFQKKIIPCFLLSLGLLAGLANIIRIGYILTTPFKRELLYTTVYVCILSIVEPATAIICLGISSWRPLFCRQSKSYDLGSSDEG